LRIPFTHYYWGTLILYISPNRVILISVSFYSGILSIAFIFSMLSSNILNVLVV